MKAGIIETMRDVSRRRFLKSTLLGAAALTMSDRLALAGQMATGRLTARDIHSVGMKPGRVDLSNNENPIGPSDLALQAIAENMPGINRYQNANEFQLIEALAEYDGVTLPENDRPRSFEDMMERMMGPSEQAGPPGPSPGRMRPPQEGPPDEEMMRRMMERMDAMRPPYMISYAGSEQFLNQLSLAYLSKGGEVVEAEMGYNWVSRSSRRYAYMGIPATAVSVPMTKDYRHDLDAMLKAITPKTRLAVITNPNNPTGTIVSYEALERFVNAVPKHVIIVIDEAYIHFVRDPAYKRAIPLAVANDNVIVIRTFSKVYGMAGMRLGYAVCGPKIQRELEFYDTSSRMFSPLLTVVAGVAAVKDLEHVRRSQQVVWDFRDRCYQEFDALGLEYIPSEGNFIMVNVGRNGDQFARDLFQKRVRVSTRYRGTEMANWIRVSAGTEQETGVFLNEFKAVLKA